MRKMLESEAKAKGRPKPTKSKVLLAWYRIDDWVPPTKRSWEAFVNRFPPECRYNMHRDDPAWRAKEYGS